MKAFYISGDIEGLDGYKVGLDKEANDRILRAHFLAAAEGLRAGGATRVMLKSFHGVPGEYPDYVETPLRPVPGEFDLPRIAEARAGLALVGFHGLPPECGWGHAYRFSNLWLNGRKIGEITLQVCRAAAAGVPTVLYAGDAHGAEEARGAAPEAVIVVLRPGSLNLDEGPMDDAKLAALRDGAERASSLAAAGRIPVPALPERFVLEVPLATEAAAAVVPKALPYPVAVSGNRVAYDAADFAGMYHFFHDMFNLAGAVSRLGKDAAGRPAERKDSQ
jgi:D-aminopeptidase